MEMGNLEPDFTVQGGVSQLATAKEGLPPLLPVGDSCQY